MNILIVDDEELIRRSLKRVFEASGHQVTEAVDGAQGLNFWRQYQPDLVVLDVLMPGLTGPQVLSEFGPRGSTKVILMSAYTGEYNLDLARKAGADLFIPKPFQNVFEVAKIAEGLFARESD